MSATQRLKVLVDTIDDAPAGGGSELVIAEYDHWRNASSSMLAQTTACWCELDPMPEWAA